jgi:hypothetical protein
MNLPARRLLAALIPLLACACGDRQPEPHAAAQPPPAPQAQQAPVQPEPERPSAHVTSDEFPFAGHLLVAESPQALIGWTTSPQGEREQGEGMLDSVVFGQRVFVRVAVSSYDAPESFVLEGAMRLRGPDGRVLHEQAVQATQADLDSEAPGVLVLMPGMDIVFDPGDAMGAYHLEGSVVSGERTMQLHQALHVVDSMRIDPAMAL